MTELAEAARAHLVDELLPLWARHGLDREQGGCWSRLGPDHAPVPDGHKRLLVHARQLYAFMRGVELGAGAFAREAAEHAREFLLRRFRDSRHGGWFTTTDDAGAPLDRGKDLYGHAFVVFALAHHGRIAGAQDSLRLALETLELVREHLADPLAGGFFEGASEDWQPLRGPRRQNPHMHLFEALLALDQAAPGSGAQAWLSPLLALLLSRWVDSTSDTLGEHFDPAWNPLPGELGDLVEPGHHYEWVWLLDRYAELAPSSGAAELSDRLLSFAERRGVDPNGGVFDQLHRDGRPKLATQRLWPQTERLKALASRGLRAELRSALPRCLARYVGRGRGGWTEQLDPEGRALSTAQNATSVYHVVFALGEVHDRLRGNPR